MTEAMLTPWGEALDREHPLPEYPRPQLRRNSYLNLNGIWEYAITKTAEKPAAMQGEDRGALFAGDPAFRGGTHLAAG